MADPNAHIDPNSPEHPEHPEHHTWLQSLMDRIQKLDTEFPLSGGETEEDFASVDDEEEGEGADAPPKEHHSMLDGLKKDVDKLDTDFPLSGGEEP